MLTDSAVTSIQEYQSAEYWAATGWIAPWLKEVDAAYWAGMIDCIGEYWMKRADWRRHILTETGRATLKTQLVTRISQASNVFVPWLSQAITMDGVRILEMGGGAG